MSGNDELSQKILTYEMNGRDRALSHLVGSVIGVYSGAMKPHILPDDMYPVIHWTMHTDDGYSLIKEDCETNARACVVAGIPLFSEYTEKVFSVRAGKNIRWEEVIESAAVREALQRQYGSSTRKYMYMSAHNEYGDCLAMSEFMDGSWVEGYYTFDDYGNFIRVADIG